MVGVFFPKGGSREVDGCWQAVWNAVLEPNLKRAFTWRSDFLRDNGHMPTFSRRPATAPRLLTACLLTLAAALGTAQASDREDHDRAQSAVRAGEAMPLVQLLARIAKDHPGQVMKVELEHEDGRLVYEVKLLQADGQLVKLLLDARTAKVLRARRHR